VLGPADNAGVLVAATTVTVATDPSFRERTPWRIGTIMLAAGPSVLAHVHGDCVEGEAVHLSWRLDRSGNAVAFAEPMRPTENGHDDRQLREMTNDPKFRRVLVTDGRSAIGQTMARACAEAGASIVFVGISDSWKPFAGAEQLRAIPGIEIVPLDLTDSTSVSEAAGQIGARVDILVNTADYIRPGGLIDRSGVTIARDEMEGGYFGLMRLAQSFGPTMRFRGADGQNNACAWVNLLSIYAMKPWGPFGAYSAAQAAMLSASLSLRAELQPSGIRVLNVFSGPTDSEWFQTLPPPKVAPAQLAKATIDALKRGIEDAYVGDIAEDFRARLDRNPKALEREIGQ
jgi:NAD(P)-dependent dehydrogenase (short-subunit alcohol dehydrogenase family)